jgi:hypothetical protein
MLENKLLVEPTDTPQIVKSKYVVDVLSLCFLNVIGSHINFLLIRDKIDI